MKKLLYSLLMIGLFTGCADNLEMMDPTGPTGEDFFQNERDVQLAVVAAYAGLTHGRNLWGHDIWGLEVLSDNGYGIGNAIYNNWDSFEFDPGDGLLENFYRYLYLAINRANLVIINTPEIDGIPSENLNNYLGQAHFLRGYEYFLLTLLFEDAPIVLEPTTQPEGFSVSASSAEDVYAQAIADLQLAEQLLPETQEESGRIVKKAATAMLSKVYLFGADELNNPDWYALAEQKAQEVITSGRFALVNDPAKTVEENLIYLWSLNGQNSTEDIFAVQHYSSGGWNNGNVGTNYPMALNPRLDRALHIWGFGFLHTFESVERQWDDNDPRKRFSLFFDGDIVVTIDGDTLGEYSTRRLTRPDARFDSGGPKKFWWSESFDRISGVSDLNARVLRYADLLLIHAEADLMADGNLSSAGAESFNEVRARVGLPEIEAGDITRDVILEERRWELFLECHRWFDLLRTRTAEQAFAKVSELDSNGNDLEKQGFVPQKFYKLPYPQAALDRNPELVQKPVWAAESEE